MAALTAIYDGNCVVCNTTRRVVNTLDWFNRVQFLDLHERTTVNLRFPFLEYESLMGEIHVIDRNERVFAGFHGTRRMLRELPLGVPLWAIMKLPGVGNWLGPKLYRFIARNRYAINRALGVDIEQIQQEEEACDTVCKMT